ncbi:hypothetical protein C8Q72DRAFT_528804 [Fomitopsis betulina]|nr:hypothetical protein C8Q72DRAFT_528804 [Fomitopsis betulina]
MALDHHTIVILAGPKLLGYFLNWCLLGALGVQCYVYHVNFPNDPLFFQGLVYFILVFEIVQTGLVTGVAFETFVYSFSEPEALTRIYYGWFFVAIMCAIVSVAVQGFFSWRIWVLAKWPWKAWVVGGIEAISLLQGVAGVVLGASLRDTASTAHVTTSRAVVVAINIWVICSAIVDVLIAITMSILMLELRGRTAHLPTERLLNKLIRMFVETGTLTASLAIVTLVLCLRLPGTQYYETTIYVLTKLYANTFVANLVSRAFFDPSRRDRVRSTEDTEDTEPGIDHRRTTAIELSTYISNVPGWTAAEAVSSLGSSTDTANRDGLDREKRVLVEDEQAVGVATS